MQARRWWVRCGLTMSALGAAAFMVASPAAAQTQKPSTAADTAKPSTMAPARAGEDDMAEFTKLDRNNDGMIDKAEAAMEPKLLGKWSDADANKDGKISKDEYAAFERKEHAAKKQ